MQKYPFILLVILFLTACENSEKTAQINKLSLEVDSLNKVLNYKESQLKVAQDSIELLKFPAGDRYAKAKRLLSDGNLSGAQTELDNLKRIFPNSQEATRIPELEAQINSEKERIKKEQERIAALGFKALPQKANVKVDYNTITLSQFNVGSQFTFDSYDDRYFYRTADRGDRYITMAMSVTSTSKSPKLPEFAVYKVNGATMSLVKTFQTEYARWSDYGAYLGNYHDNSNDFSKVSTIKFKLGAEVEESIVKGAYAIVMYNGNVLSEEYDRWKNPPQYWIGSAPFESSLTLDSFSNNKYILVKLTNLK